MRTNYFESCPVLSICQVALFDATILVIIGSNKSSCFCVRKITCRTSTCLPPFVRIGGVAPSSICVRCPAIIIFKFSFVRRMWLVWKLFVPELTSSAADRFCLSSLVSTRWRIYLTVTFFFAGNIMRMRKFRVIFGLNLVKLFYSGKRNSDFCINIFRKARTCLTISFRSKKWSNGSRV